ncbi:NADH-FMN oxidoreductase RutF, flavin reductase (DIM6/NTAB) family [Devosia sp. YR412]|uniref:flavin reductase family protein n=1 Tax=Devosia sp. YR412 TaxID=1881030 RepID=UPI0008C2C3C8|nr:flavin reductase family protein [Devosia sp. YR412]SEP67381.1 NADH-FMN oxidoreductase RutF, flavin reductase (DIM6/NTAB) family [Devosia sp. YR412]
MSIIDLASYMPSHQPSADVPAFKHAMGRLAGAVNVITIGTGQSRTGFTATSVSSYSVEPPTILVSLNRNSSSWQALLEARSFAVNILAEGQSDVADRFAGRGGIKGNDRYVGWEWDRLGSGTLGLSGAVSVIDCDIDEIIERHSHAIVLGRVRTVETDPDVSPLLYWRGDYQNLAGL